MIFVRNGIVLGFEHNLVIADLQSKANITYRVCDVGVVSQTASRLEAFLSPATAGLMCVVQLAGLGEFGDQKK